MRVIYSAETILDEDIMKPIINVVMVWLHEGFTVRAPGDHAPGRSPQLVSAGPCSCSPAGHRYLQCVPGLAACAQSDRVLLEPGSGPGAGRRLAGKFSHW